MGIQIPLDASAPLLRITAEQFEAMYHTGAFTGLPRLELRDGVLCQLNAQYRPHLLAKKHIYDSLLQALSAPLGVASEGSVRVDDYDVPMPDVIVWTVQRGQGAIPVELVRLVVEVSESTLRDDLGRKRQVYAAAGVPEYWVVDLEGELIHQFWLPEADAYTETQRIPFGQTLSAATLPGIGINTAPLLEDMP